MKDSEADCNPPSALKFWLWAATVPLTVLYAFVVKTVFTKEKMIKMWGWPAEYPLGFIRFVGICEGAGVIGLVLPVLTGILPWRTPLAAICLTILQIFAMRVHIKRRDNFALNSVLLPLAAFVAWGYLGYLHG